jgi:hypothetical protein
MFGVEPELLNRSADLVCDCGFSRGSGPAIAAARVLELQITSVGKIQQAAIECTVHGVPCDVSPGVIGEVHNTRLTNLKAGLRDF